MGQMRTQIRTLSLKLSLHAWLHVVGEAVAEGGGAEVEVVAAEGLVAVAEVVAEVVVVEEVVAVAEVGAARKQWILMIFPIMRILFLPAQQLILSLKLRLIVTMTRTIILPPMV